MSRKSTGTVQADRPCNICGGFAVYPKTLQCAECNRRRCYERSEDDRRKREGLRPTVAGSLRQERRDLLETDRVLRDLARATGDARYHSLRACKRGHRAPERYTSTGGCVRCAAAASRRQYSRTRKS
jgi:hypothetical protein